MGECFMFVLARGFDVFENAVRVSHAWRARSCLYLSLENFIVFNYYHLSVQVVKMQVRAE